MKSFSSTSDASQSSDPPPDGAPNRGHRERSIFDVSLLWEESSKVVSRNLERTKEISALEVKSPKLFTAVPAETTDGGE